MRGYSYAERNQQLIECDSRPGRHGQLRLRRNDDIFFAAKKKQEFQCLDCGAGSKGGWTMQFDNVRLGKGCPICAVSDKLAQGVASRWSNYRLIIIVHPAGVPVSAKTRYKVVPRNNPLPESFGWMPDEMTRSAIASGIRYGKRPGSRQDAGYDVAVRVFQTWKDAFEGKGSIRYAGKKKPGSSSPGPFFAIDTGKRSMRAIICEPYMAARGVLGICKQEKDDKLRDLQFRVEASRFGATITNYNTTDVFGLRIEYTSRTGFPRNDTHHRAKEVMWGQTMMRKGEKLCAIVLSEFFPETDWKLNGRYPFLTYASEGKAPSLLELDGYSESLKIAFEYQGDQHFNARDEVSEAKLSVEEIKARDRFKVDACRGAGITLLVVREMDLDPEHFLKELKKIFLNHRLTPANPYISTDKIWQKWNQWCENPLADFQGKVIANLNKHKLISPAREKIAKRSMVNYKCANCQTINSTIAKSLAEGEPRIACIKCKGEVAGKTRRDATLDAWEGSSSLPAGFVANIKQNSTVGAKIYICERNHRINVYGLKFVERHIIDGEFRCPECDAIRLGVSASQVVAQRQSNDALLRDLGSIGLTIVEMLPPQNGRTTAMVACSNHHNFVVTRHELDRLMLNKCMNAPPIVPAACHECCYPGVPRESVILLRSTVHHRLGSLRGLYPKIVYRAGFDPKGESDETYNCGNVFADGTPHPDLQISWKNLQKAGTGTRAKNHLCPACGILAGQVVGGKKTLMDVTAHVHALRDTLHQTHPPQPKISLLRPVVKYVRGPFDEAMQQIVSQKTVLSIWCGTEGHSAVEVTKDSYFNRAPTKGYGFCKQCVTEAKLAKAPIPDPPDEPLPTLLRCQLRAEGPEGDGKRRSVSKRRYQSTKSPMLDEGDQGNSDV